MVKLLWSMTTDIISYIWKLKLLYKIRNPSFIIEEQITLRLANISYKKKLISNFIVFSYASWSVLVNQFTLWLYIFQVLVTIIWKFSIFASWTVCKQFSRIFNKGTMNIEVHFSNYPSLRSLYSSYLSKATLVVTSSISLFLNKQYGKCNNAASYTVTSWSLKSEDVWFYFILYAN